MPGLSPAALSRILKHYGLIPKKIHPVQSGYRNYSHHVQLADGRDVNLIIYKSEPGILDRIHHANYVSGHLAAHGLPVRALLNPRIISVKTNTTTRYGALYSYLPGHTIAWEAYTKIHIKKLGQALSLMHATLKDLDTSDLPLVIDEYADICERMDYYFGERQVMAAIATKLGFGLNQTKLDRHRSTLNLCRKLSIQPLHMDFVRGNVLFGEDEAGETSITGIIDFEKTSAGHPIFDIARTLAFLLVDCKYKPADKVSKYFLYSGYTKRGDAPYRPITLCTLHHRIDVLDILIEMFLFYDLYKFLRHNPYESLSQNEHYLRTRDILLRRGVITPSDDRIS